MFFQSRATTRLARFAAFLLLLGTLAACGGGPVVVEEEIINGVPVSQIDPDYGILPDGEYTLPPVPPE